MLDEKEEENQEAGDTASWKEDLESLCLRLLNIQGLIVVFHDSSPDEKTAGGGCRLASDMVRMN
jgi:hypothetical protein